MRIKNLIKGDMRFQVKYGFYFVYAILTLLYTLLICALPDAVKEKAAIIMIYTDPAAMGLFFMGAIILLEKSQRVLDSITVSPVKVSEYILSKIISLGIIGTLVGTLLSILAGNYKIFQVMAGVFLGSIIFSLIGLSVAAKINSLNQFMIATVPFEIIFFLPPLLYLFGYKKSFMLLHPGCVIIRLLSGENGFDLLPVIVLLGWILLLYQITCVIVKRMFQSVGGVKL